MGVLSEWFNGIFSRAIRTEGTGRPDFSPCSECAAHPHNNAGKNSHTGSRQRGIAILPKIIIKCLSTYEWDVQTFFGFYRDFEILVPMPVGSWMKPSDAKSEETNTAGKLEDKPMRSPGGSALALVMLVLFVLLIIMDYSNIIFADSRRGAALDLVKPGMRLTQAERTLNEAGYMTLYIDENPPWLQVSTFTRWPLTADLLHRVFPNSKPDEWLRSRLSNLTRFYIAGAADGTVRFSSDNRPMFSRTWHYPLSSSKTGDFY